MRFRPPRTWVATITAALFVFSAVATHVVAAGAGAASEMAMSAGDMASHDDGMPCQSSSDCGDRMNMQAMACFAHCATVLGVLADWVVDSEVTIARLVRLPVTLLLTSLHGLTEPPPPRS